MLIFSLAFSAPLYATRGAALVLWVVKEFGLDLVARALARKMLNALQNGIINEINNLGVEKGKKAPGFVQNWKKFLADAKRIGENQFRSQLSYVIRNGLLCGDLRGPLAKAYQISGTGNIIDIGKPDLNAELQQDSLTPFQTRIKCTIPEKVRETFKKSFEKGGGWETWSRIVEPQNNIAGALAITMEELSKQRSSQENARQSEVIAGKGYTGVQGPCRGIGQNAECTFLGKTVTPADILGKGAAQWLDSNAQWLTSSDELSEVLVNILNAAMNKLTSFVTFGLLTPQDIANLKNQAANQSSSDTTGTPADGLAGKAQADCVSTCVEQRERSCDRLNLTPEAKQTCYADGRSACEQQCAP